MAETATQPVDREPADATPPSSPALQAGAAMAGPRPGNAQRSRIRAIGLQRAPHKDLYHFVLAQSWPRFFLLTGLMFVMTNLVFATFYWLSPGSVANARPGSFEEAFYFSVQTLATIGYGGMT